MKIISAMFVRGGPGSYDVRSMSTITSDSIRPDTIASFFVEGDEGAIVVYDMESLPDELWEWLVVMLAEREARMKGAAQ